MLRKFIYTVCSIAIANCFFAQSNTISFTEKLNKIDQNVNDSFALASLEEMAAQAQLSVKSHLEISHRIIARANVLGKLNYAVTLANEGIVIAGENGMDSLEAVFNKLLGVSYYYLDQKKSALPYFEKANQISKRNNFWALEASCNNNMGGALADLQRFDEAEPYLLKSIAIMSEHGKGNTVTALRTYRVLARVYSENRKKDKAEAIYLHLIEKSKAIKDTGLLCDNLLFYSEILSERGEIEKAVEMSGEVLKFKRARKRVSDLEAALQIHAVHLALAGRHKEAYDLIVEALSVFRTTFASDLKAQISEVEVKYKTAQLKQEKEIAEIKTKKQRQIYLFSFLGIAVLAGSGFFVWNTRKETRHKIRLQQERLETLVEGEEKERVRIAKDLHDGIVQDLTAIQLKLNQELSESPERSQQNLNSVIKDLDRATKEVREISYQMMPLALKEHGLIRAIDDLLQKTLGPKGIKYEFEALNFEARLSEKIEVTLYRITQELVNNVIKHSAADFVSVVVSKREGSVFMVFEDNGKGFNANEITKGIGMNSLSSRLQMVHGNLQFETGLSAGTIATIKIPLS
jgi:signal transduction histidine kinase